MSNLISTIQEIKTLSTNIQTLNVSIEEVQRAIENEKITIQNVKFGYERVIYFSAEYKNDKQRELTLKGDLSCDDMYSDSQRQIYKLGLDLAGLENDKAILKIELDHQRNILRVAEIESVYSKVGI